MTSKKFSIKPKTIATITRGPNDLDIWLCYTNRIEPIKFQIQMISAVPEKCISGSVHVEIMAMRKKLGKNRTTEKLDGYVLEMETGERYLVFKCTYDTIKRKGIIIFDEFK